MKRSKHSLSNYRLSTLNMGILYPIGCIEVLPGDSFRHQTAALLRVSPLVAPVMHPVHAMVHHWYVPSRLLWSNWENFITGTDPNLVVPTITYNATSDTAFKKLAQALGVGADTATAVTISSLALRAYNMIWNEYYRDQDLNTAAPERLGDSGDLVADYLLRAISWEKDYFTTCRANPQQGSNTEVVQLSLSGEVPVKGLGVFNLGTASGTSQAIHETPNVDRSYTKNFPLNATGNNTVYAEAQASTNYPNVRVDLSQITGGSVNMDINQWRKSMAMQRMREHRNRFGSRYKDLLAYLGVNSSDARLQRPEYLGGGKQTISFSEVLSTADAGTADVGSMAGHGIAALRTRPYKRFFEEHGYQLSFLSVRPVSVYQQQIPRHFLRRDYEQYWQKELEMMGDQAVTNAEIYGDAGTPAGTFGYIPRYDEYRHQESFVTGEFRNILNYWHMARIFGSQPVLNGSFVSCDPTTRIYGATANDQLYGMFAHRIAARRLVSRSGVSA